MHRVWESSLSPGKRPARIPLSQAIEDGKIEVFFEGNHIKGGYA